MTAKSLAIASLVIICPCAQAAFATDQRQAAVPELRKALAELEKTAGQASDGVNAVEGRCSDSDFAPILDAKERQIELPSTGRNPMPNRIFPPSWFLPDETPEIYFSNPVFPLNTPLFPDGIQPGRGGYGTPRPGMYETLPGRPYIPLRIDPAPPVKENQRK